jgi:hypothetical protein
MPSASPSHDASYDWTGYWRVQRYDGAPPDRPTFYDASPASWDVLTAKDAGLYEARHPILSVEDDILVLKDEGEADENAERWRVAVDGNRVRVTALTGPHEGAVGLAERIDTDPRTLTFQ